MKISNHSPSEQFGDLKIVLYGDLFMIYLFNNYCGSINE